MKSFKVIASLVLIVGAGFFMIRFFGSQSDSGNAVASLMPLCCEECGKAFTKVVVPSDLPEECCFCGGDSYRAYYCVDCDTIVPSRSGKPAGAECSDCPDSVKKGDVPKDRLEECP